ncbi:unnamed protein product [Sphagnum tenellum]
MSDSISEISTETPTTAAPDAALSITDIQNAIRVIDYAADQGAFKGWETIQQVLVVRNRMNDFLKAVVPPTSDAVAQETTV